MLSLFKECMNAKAELKNEREKNKKAYADGVANGMNEAFVSIMDMYKSIKYGTKMDSTLNGLLSKFRNVITSNGYTIIDMDFLDDRCGGVFDVEYCSAIYTESESNNFNNHIYDVIEDGLIDRDGNVIMHAKVCVSVK